MIVEHQSTKSRFWSHIPTPNTHGYPGGGVVVFSDDPGQVESILVSVLRTNQGPSRANIEKTSQLPGLILNVTECEQPIEKNLQQTEKCSGKVSPW